MSSSLQELFSEIDGKRKYYLRLAKIEEWAFWIGSTLSAVCSGIAALSILSNVSSWNDPYGKILTALLAIIPAIWTALDRNLRLRQLSMSNYNIETLLHILLWDLKSQGDALDIREASQKYQRFLEDEQRITEIFMSGFEKPDQIIAAKNQNRQDSNKDQNNAPERTI